MGPKLRDRGKGRGRVETRDEGRSHMKTGGEVGRMLPQARGHLQPPAAGGVKEAVLSWSSSGGGHGLLTPEFGILPS